MRMKTLTILIALGTALSFGSALAAGGGGGGGSSEAPKERTKTTKECKEGEIWSRWRRKCVKAQDSSLGDRDLYQAGQEFAYAGQYENAVNALSHIVNQNDPATLNMLGYAHRKLGKIDTGLAFYKRALDLNPNYVLARAYLGEGMLSTGDFGGAKQQLDEIAARAGSNSDAYRYLANAINNTDSYSR